MTLGIVILNSNVIGAEGLGNISLIILAVSIFILLTGFVSGALVYFVPRENVFQLFIISYAWTFIMFFVFFIFITLVPVVDKNFIYHVSALSLILSGANINEKILAGKEKIITVNYISLLKTISMIVSLPVLYFILKEKTVMSYVFSLYISYSVGFFLTLFGIMKFLKDKKINGFRLLLIKVFKLSGYNTVAAIVQKLNYRLGYYFIEYFLGIKALGIFSAGVQISESTLIISRSISFVQYSKISNTNNFRQSVSLTVTLAKIVLLISSGIMLVFSMLPSSFYSFVFGHDFTEINTVIKSLSFGIAALSLNLIIMHFFSGTGNQKFNMMSASAGFAITVFCGLLLIPEFGIFGAGISASFSYLTSALLQIYFFTKLTGIGWSAFIIRKKDFINGISALKNLLLSKNKE